MRILVLNWRDIKHEWAGGGEIYIHELAKRWVKSGHQVTLFCGQGVGNSLPSEEVVDGISIVRKGGIYTVFLWAIWFYITRFRKNHDVVVDVQNGVPFFTVLYSRKPKIAIVYHIHGKQFFIELPFPYNYVGYSIERFLFPFLYRTIQIQAISKTTLNDLMALGLSKKHIHIIYCGINGKQNRIKKTYVKFVSPTILYLGRIKKYKRVDMLVRYMSEITKRVKKARLLLAGWGTEASYVTDVSMRSSQRRKIRIIGPVSECEKRKLLQKSWVFVNPSINEGWGISVIEANLYGTPAISFDVAGLSESIRNGKTGILVKSEAEFIEKIVLLLTNSRLRQTLGDNARRWSSTFSWDTASKESLKLILSQVSGLKKSRTSPYHTKRASLA